jgi:hypothetical protein
MMVFQVDLLKTGKQKTQEWNLGMDTGINSQKNATDFPHHYSLPLQFF